MPLESYPLVSMARKTRTIRGGVHPRCPCKWRFIGGEIAEIELKGL